MEILATEKAHLKFGGESGGQRGSATPPFLLLVPEQPQQSTGDGHPLLLFPRIHHKQCYVGDQNSGAQPARQGLQTGPLSLPFTPALCKPPKGPLLALGMGC